MYKKIFFFAVIVLIFLISITTVMIKMNEVVRYYKKTSCKGYYGQYLEDVALHGMVKTFLKKDIKDIFYVEIGVYEPIKDNHTYFFYQRGAKGVLVDPLPYSIKKIKKYRPDDILFENAVTDGESNQTMTLHTAGGATSLNKYEKKHETGKIDVKTINVNDLLFKINHHVDIFSIDIEGYEEKVIEAMDFSRYNPSIIICERPTSKIFKKLKKNDYIPYFVSGYEFDKYGLNVFFIKKDLFEKYISQDFQNVHYDVNEVLIQK